jgi:hypothetical protein
MKNSILMLAVLCLLAAGGILTALAVQTSRDTAGLLRGGAYPAGLPVELPAEVPAAEQDTSGASADQAVNECQTICAQSCTGFSTIEEENDCQKSCRELCVVGY